MSEGALFVVDELRSVPGCADQLRAAYLEGYAPRARTRGMTMVHAWRTPPLDLLEGSTTLTFVWSVEGRPGWWRARLGAAGDPVVMGWWDQVRPLVAEHRRIYHEGIATDV